MSVDLDRLEALARAATSGPWKEWLVTIQESALVSAPAPSVVYFENGTAFHVARCTGWDNREADAAYIAAVSPEVVLALIRRLKDAESSWPFCGRCGEGEDAVECECCRVTGCDVCIPQGGRKAGLCSLCVKAGVE